MKHSNSFQPKSRSSLRSSPAAAELNRQAPNGNAMRVLATFLILLLTGCGETGSKFFDWLSGVKANIVVLEPRPFELTENPMTWDSREPMTVLGEDYAMCFVLKYGVPLSDVKTMEKKADDVLKGASINVTIKFQDGTEQNLRALAPAWSLYGNVGPDNELSACAASGCSKIVVGTRVESVSAVSTQPVTLQSAYWKSTSDLGAPGT